MMAPVTKEPSLHGESRRQLCAAMVGLSAWATAAPVWGALRPGSRVKLALIDTLSGPVAPEGRNAMRSWAFLLDRLQADSRLNPLGLRFHFAAFDNAGSPQTSVNMLKAAIDQGFRWFAQGLGSGVATALTEAIGRHNRRNPDDPVVLINYAAMDPALTNERCSFWHYRVDADTSMKMRALVRFMAGQPQWQRVHLVNQDYSHGQQVSAHVKRYLQELAPHTRVVGDDLHPLFGNTDFARYAQGVADSGAQALITGNWGADLRGLVQALASHGLRLPVFTYFASLTGTPQVLAQVGDRLPIYQVATYHDRQGGVLDSIFSDFHQKHREDLVMVSIVDAVVLLMRAMNAVRSSQVRAVAPRMSGMLFEGFNGPVQMRPDDHQLQKGVYITRWVRQVVGQGRSAEGTGWQFVPAAYVPADDLREPSRCVMVRPDY